MSDFRTYRRMPNIGRRVQFVSADPNPRSAKALGFMALLLAAPALFSCAADPGPNGAGIDVREELCGVRLEVARSEELGQSMLRFSQALDSRYLILVPASDQSGDGVLDVIALSFAKNDAFESEHKSEWSIATHSGADGNYLVQPERLAWADDWFGYCPESVQFLWRDETEKTEELLVALVPDWGGGTPGRPEKDLTRCVRVTSSGANSVLTFLPRLGRCESKGEVNAISTSWAFPERLGVVGSIGLNSIAVDVDGYYLLEKWWRLPVGSPIDCIQAMPPTWSSEPDGMLVGLGLNEVFCASTSAARPSWTCAALALRAGDRLRFGVGMMGNDDMRAVAFTTDCIEGDWLGSRMFVWIVGKGTPVELSGCFQRGEFVERIVALPDLTNDGLDDIGVLINGPGMREFRVIDSAASAVLARASFEEFGDPRPIFLLSLRGGDRACSVFGYNAYTGDAVPMCYHVRVTW